MTTNTTSYDAAHDFLPSDQAKSRGLLAKVRAVAEAVHEGHVAARRYQELRAGGIAHDAAVKRVFAEVYAAG